MIIKEAPIVPGTVQTHSRTILLLTLSVLNLSYTEVYRTTYSALENVEIELPGQIFSTIKTI